MFPSTHRESNLRFSRVLVVLGALACARALAFGAPAVAVAGVCSPSATQLCTQGGLIAVEATWGDPAQDAQAVALGSSRGWFFFDDAEAPEMYIEVLDGCALNDRYWVKRISLSDRASSLSVRNVDTGEQALYVQPTGTISSIFDVDAFMCSQPLDPVVPHMPEGGASGVVELLDGRFTARVIWTMPGDSGVALPQVLASRGAAFGFFSPSSVNAAVKIEDGDAGFFRVFYGWTSSTAFELEVIDRCTGNRAVYSIPDGAGTGGAVDESSFPLTPSCVLFSDGFESGDLSGWD